MSQVNGTTQSSCAKRYSGHLAEAKEPQVLNSWKRPVADNRVELLLSENGAICMTERLLELRGQSKVTS